MKTPTYYHHDDPMMPEWVKEELATDPGAENLREARAQVLLGRPKDAEGAILLDAETFRELAQAGLSRADVDLAIDYLRTEYLIRLFPGSEGVLLEVGCAQCQPKKKN